MIKFILIVLVIIIIWLKKLIQYFFDETSSDSKNTTHLKRPYQSPASFTENKSDTNNQNHNYSVTETAPRKTNKQSASKKVTRTKKKQVHVLKNKLPDNLVITEDFKEAFELMEHTSECAYITGKAGTGKSTLLTYFRQQTKKNIVVLAPTGIAAINVEGSTIHSFFRFRTGIIENSIISVDNSREELFRNLNMIVIDEISMVRADILDGIDFSLRKNRKSNKPFGGVQMIFFGDLCQLPPVVSREEMSYFLETFGGIYFFNAKVFKTIDLKYIELHTVFRQKDEDFKNVLNSIRENKITEKELELLNTRYNPNLTIEAGDVRLTLATTKNIVKAINVTRMNNLTTQEYTYTAEIKGVFDKNTYPTEEKLTIREGAQIMMLKNDTLKRWANGSLGIVKEINEEEVIIEIDNNSYTLEPSTWEVVEFEYNQDTKKIESVVTGSFSQYAIKPAWAMTIHKSQGQTFDKVIIDLGSGSFAHGQTYVALSRCKSLEGITLTKMIRSKDIIIDPQVAEFIKQKGQKIKTF